MKNYTTSFILLSILVFNCLVADAQICQWAYSEGYSNYTSISSLKKDFNGDFYIGTHEDSMSHALHTRFEKRDAAQNILWSMDFPAGTEITDIEINSMNHPVFTGYYTDTLVIGADSLMSVGYSSSFIVETDEQGIISWAISFNPNGNEFKPVDLFIDKYDDLYLTAQIAGTHGFCSFHKLDHWGQPVHDEFNDNFEDRTFSHLLVDNDGNIYISGTCGTLATFDSLTVSPNFSYENMLVKYDSSFTAQWVISRSYITFDDNNGLGSDGQNLYWSFDEATNSADTIRLVKTDYSGQVLLDVAGPLGDSFFPSVTFETDSSGNGLLVANVYTRLYLYHFDNQFNMLWHDTIFVNTSGYPPQVRIECDDSSFYVGGKYYSDSLYVDSILLLNPNAPGYHPDIFLAKWAWTNSVSVSSINQNNFFRFYPNPANDHLNIYYDKNVSTELNIEDYSGKNIFYKNISGFGNHDIDISSLKNGYYILKMKCEGSKNLFNSRLIIIR